MRIDLEYPCLRLFSEKEHAEQFVDGSFWMSSIKRYRDICEDDSGIGDAYEGIRLIRSKMILSTSPQFEAPAPELQSLENVTEIDMPLRIPEVDASVVLCSTQFWGESLELVDKNDETYRARISDALADFIDKQDNGKSEVYAVFFSAREMSEAIRSYANENGLFAISRSIEYGPKHLTAEEIERLRKGEPPINMILFHKREKYNNQFEYRFALLPKPGASPEALTSKLNPQGFLEVSIPTLRNFETVIYEVER